MSVEDESATRVAGAPAATSSSPSVLTDEWVLRGCATVEHDGRTCPVLGRVALVERIGKGGMGVVYRGTNPRLGIEVAVKVLPPSLEKEQDGFAERFVREARIAARLRSEHLVSVIDVDRDVPSGCHFLVMEYVHGATAAQWIHDLVASGRRHAREGDALDVCIAATRGLAAAHAEGIVHRDVKPANILLPAGPDGRPQLARAKLADLGLARGGVGEDSLTATQTALGTPGYMAPEQAQDSHRAGKPADIFSMGATLYAFLTGNAPFRGSTPVEAIIRTVQGEFQPLAEVRRDVSAATTELVERCLAPEASARYQDASTLLRALEVCRGALGASASDAAAAAARVVELAGTAAPPPAARTAKPKPAVEDTATCAQPAAARAPVRAVVTPAARNGGHTPLFIAAVASVSLLGLGIVAVIAIPALRRGEVRTLQIPAPRAATAPTNASADAGAARDESASAAKDETQTQDAGQDDGERAASSRDDAGRAEGSDSRQGDAGTRAAAQRPAAPVVGTGEKSVVPALIASQPTGPKPFASAPAEEPSSDPLAAAQRFDLEGLPGREDSYTEEQLRKLVASWRRGDLGAALDLQRRLAQFYFRIGDSERARIAQKHVATLERAVAERTADAAPSPGAGPAPAGPSAPEAPVGGAGGMAPPPPPPPPPPPGPSGGPKRGR